MTIQAICLRQKMHWEAVQAELNLKQFRPYLESYIQVVSHFSWFFLEITIESFDFNIN